MLSSFICTIFMSARRIVELNHGVIDVLNEKTLKIYLLSVSISLTDAIVVDKMEG